MGDWQLWGKIQLFIVIYLSVCHLQYTQFIHQYERDWVILWDVAAVPLRVDVDFYIWSVIISVTVLNPLTKGNEREGKVQLIGSSPLLTKSGQVLKAGAWRRNRRGLLLANSLLGLCLARSSIQSKTTCPWSSDTHGRLSPFTPTKKAPPRPQT